MKTALLFVALLPSLCSAGIRTVWSAEFGAAWPFVPSTGDLGCIRVGGRDIATFRPKAGATYGLTGSAIVEGYPEIDPIWRENPAIPGAKVNIGPIIDAARALCSK